MKGISRLTMRLPGSTTNLGPGFDTLGLALGVYTTVTFEVGNESNGFLANKPLVTLKGPLAQGLSATEDNLIFKVFRDNFTGNLEKLAAIGSENSSDIASLSRTRNSSDITSIFKITIETDIPLARGLGSSSTAILAALWAAQTFSSPAAPDRDQILASAARLEGHPDNVAACLMGGFIISGYTQKGNRALTSRLNWPDKWHTLIVVPPYELSTHEARRVLPKRVEMSQAVNNVQRTGLLIGAVVNGDDDILREALSDQLHEPYRIHLVPELQALRRELPALPVLGCVLSGAGSSSLVIVHEKHKTEVKTYLEDWAQKRKQKPQILDLTVDKKGLVATYE
ncbi:MAG: homoserine kinase [Cyanobacteria bacterium SZAS TMP-1]|nr:homoserine kinase [Cyanobacteria bacterium SZAS TMP-1]